MRATIAQSMAYYVPGHFLGITGSGNDYPCFTMNNWKHGNLVSPPGFGCTNWPKNPTLPPIMESDRKASYFPFAAFLSASVIIGKRGNVDP